MDRLLSADGPDEILWQRVSLALLLDEARAHRPAPRPESSRPLAPLVPETSRGLRTWLRRRKSPCDQPPS